MNNPLEVNQLNQLIASNIPNSKYKIIGEINNLKNSHGHFFLVLKDDSDCINCVLWKSKAHLLEEPLNDGDKIIVEGKISYYCATGNVSFIIDKIISIEGTGKFYKLYQKYQKKFEDLGYFNKDIKLILPEFISNVLLITSETGAAIQDFFYNIKKNKSLLNYDICNVTVQGKNCPKNLIKKLKLLDKEGKLKKYDLIIITRGGGSFEDLFGFSKPKLIEYMYEFKHPVLSAIGHVVDNPLLDRVADFSTPTPSLAGQFIIDHNKSYITILKNDLDIMKNKMRHHIDEYKSKITEIKDNLSKHLLFLERTKITFEENIKNMMNNKLRMIEEYLNKLKRMEANEEIIFLFGSKKLNNINKIIKKLENNRSIRIISGNKKILIKNYDYEIYDNSVKTLSE